jgi:outer membrane protein TolC
VTARLRAALAIVPALLLAGAAGSPGQEPPVSGAAGPEAVLTLADAVEAALARYPSVAAARARVDEARGAFGEAEAAARPKVRLSASALQYEEPMVVTPIHGFEPGLFPEFDRTLLQGQLAASWTLYDGGAHRARLAGAGSQAGGAEAARAAAEQSLALRVAAVYLAVLGDREVLAAHDARLEALEGELSRSGQRFEAGKAPRVEVLRAEAALASAEAERVALTATLETDEGELARLLGAEPAALRRTALVGICAPVEPGVPDQPDVPDVPDDPEVPGGAAGRARTERNCLSPQGEFEHRPQIDPPLRRALTAEAREASPAVEEARRRLAAADAGVALAKSAYRPELRAVANLNEWSSSELDLETEWNAGFQVAVPIFDGGLTRSRVARAEAARRGAAEQLRLAELDVEEAVDRAFAAADEADARVASLAKAVERFEEVARIQRLLLDAGAGTQTDTLNALADLLSARANLTRAGHGAVLARVQLARALGRLTPEWLRRSLTEGPAGENLESLR